MVVYQNSGQFLCDSMAINTPPSLFTELHSILSTGTFPALRSHEGQASLPISTHTERAFSSLCEKLQWKSTQIESNNHPLHVMKKNK